MSDVINFITSKAIWNLLETGRIKGHLENKKNLDLSLHLNLEMIKINLFLVSMLVV
mgnify:CR=1 FL=1